MASFAVSARVSSWTRAGMALWIHLANAVQVQVQLQSQSQCGVSVCEQAAPRRGRALALWHCGGRAGQGRDASARLSSAGKQTGGSNARSVCISASS